MSSLRFRHALRPRFLLGLALCVVLFYFLLLNRNNITFKMIPGFLSRVTLKPPAHVEAEKQVEQLCKLPKTELYPNDFFKKFFRDIPDVKCPGEEWVEIHVGVFRILKSAREKYGEIICNYTQILRGGNDFSYRFGESIKNVKDGWNVTSEGSLVSCSGKNNASYSNYHLTVPYVKKYHDRERGNKLPETSLGMNILFFGYDSVSRMTWLRKLPKTYAYMRDVLGSVVLEGYNAVGDGTLGSFLPILTGYLEEELPSLKAKQRYLDKNPWMWTKYKNAGYVVQFSEDEPAAHGTFTWKLKGFEKPPTDYNVLPFFSLIHKKATSHCVGSKFRHSMLLNYIKDFQKMYKNERKFSYSFSAKLSHDHIEQLNIADDETKKWIQFLHEGGFLNNTLLLLMCDHGARFNGVRETLQGTIEERNPFVSIRVPPWFKDKYPKAFKHILTNSKRLTTPFDVHETLLDVLHYRNISRGNLSKRGISLFSEIPPDRLCRHAGVTLHWCNCLNWAPLRNDSQAAKNAAMELITLINDLIAKERSICHDLKLDRIIEAKEISTDSLLRRGKGLRVRNAGTTMYRIVVQTKPGKAHFQAIVRFNTDKKKYEIKTPDISRINAFGKDVDCLAKNKRNLSKFCFCKNR